MGKRIEERGREIRKQKMEAKKKVTHIQVGTQFYISTYSLQFLIMTHSSALSYLRLTHSHNMSHYCYIYMYMYRQALVVYYQFFTIQAIQDILMQLDTCPYFINKSCVDQI